MNDIQNIINNIEAWGYSVNARVLFSNFINSLETKCGNDDAMRHILQIIDEIVLGKEKEQFMKIIEPGMQFYRARIIDASDDGCLEKGIGITSEGKYVGYNEENSKEPIIGISSNGRNNIAGASYLYIASNPETACIEIKSQFGDLISLATFQINEPIKIIDFASDKEFQTSDSKNYGIALGVLFTQLMLRFMEPVKETNAYKATQIISDHLRKTGIDGIAYKSFLSPSGINYTIFNCHSSKIKYCESKIVIHKQANHSFWDLNAEKEIMSNREEKEMKWNSEVAGKLKRKLSERIQIINSK